MYWVSLSIAAITLTWMALNLSESQRSANLSADLQEITNQRPDAFMEGVYQRTFSQNGTLRTTLIADSLLDFGSRANAQLKTPRF